MGYRGAMNTEYLKEAAICLENASRSLESCEPKSKQFVDDISTLTREIRATRISIMALWNEASKLEPTEP